METTAKQPLPQRAPDWLPPDKSILTACLVVTGDGIFLFFLWFALWFGRSEVEAKSIAASNPALLPIMDAYGIFILPVLIGLIAFHVWALWQPKETLRRFAWNALSSCIVISVDGIVWLIGAFFLQLLFETKDLPGFFPVSLFLLLGLIAFHLWAIWQSNEAIWRRAWRVLGSYLAFILNGLIWVFVGLLFQGLWLGMSFADYLAFTLPVFVGLTGCHIWAIWHPDEAIRRRAWSFLGYSLVLIVDGANLLLVWLLLPRVGTMMKGMGSLVPVIFRGLFPLADLFNHALPLTLPISFGLIALHLWAMRQPNPRIRHGAWGVFVASAFFLAFFVCLVFWSVTSAVMSGPRSIPGNH